MQITELGFKQVTCERKRLLYCQPVVNKLQLSSSLQNSWIVKKKLWSKYWNSLLRIIGKLQSKENSTISSTEAKEASYYLPKPYWSTDRSLCHGVFCAFNWQGQYQSFSISICLVSRRSSEMRTTSRTKSLTWAITTNCWYYRAVAPLFYISDPDWSRGWSL